EDAGVTPDAVTYINAHGTGTPHNDEAETTAIKRVFGEHAARLAVSSTKSMTGHLLGASGAVEVIYSILTVGRGVIPPTINLDDPDPPCALDYVPPGPRGPPAAAALPNPSGFGGTTVCGAARRYA